MTSDRFAALSGCSGHTVVASVSVDLQKTFETVKQSLGVFATATGSIVVDNTRRFVAGPCTVIARQRPKVAGFGFAAPWIENRGGRLVHEQLR